MSMVYNVHAEKIMVWYQRLPGKSCLGKQLFICTQTSRCAAHSLDQRWGRGGAIE